VSGACATVSVPPSGLTARYGMGAGVTADGRVYAFGGSGSGMELNTLEMYDPATNGWTVRAPMPAALWAPAGAVGSDNRVYSIGGETSLGAPTAAVYAYSPATNTWVSVSSVSVARWSIAAVRGMDGRIYAFGGGDNSTTSRTAEVYDVASNRWTTLAPMPLARRGPGAAAALDGRIFVVGGIEGSVRATSVQIYTPSTNTWAMGPALSVGRSGPGVTRGPDGRIYIAGGFTGTGNTYLATAVALDPISGSYATLSSMGTARSYFGFVTLLDGRLMAIEGETPSQTTGTSSVETYSVGADAWR
jgi:N-acetylneuraminic acid mutarotase